MSAIVKTVTRPRKLIFAPAENRDNATRKQSDKSLKSYTDEESELQPCRNTWVLVYRDQGKATEIPEYYRDQGRDMRD